MVKKMKKAVILVLSTAATHFGKKLNNEQEILLQVSDMLIQTYAAESCVLRAEKLLTQKGKEKTKHHIELTQLFVHQAAGILFAKGQESIIAFANGDQRSTLLCALSTLTSGYHPNCKDLRRSIAKQLIDQNRYCF